MKKLLAVVVVLVAGLATYNYVTTGKVSLSVARTVSAEERQLGGLEAELAAARSQWAGANRGAGLAGIDTSSDVVSARASALQIDAELRRLRPRLETKSLQDRAERLTREIASFLRETG